MKNKAALRRFRPNLDILEDRFAPAQLTVNTLADGPANHGDALLTLREAVDTVTSGNANGLSAGELGQISGTLGTSDTIVFASSLTSGGPATISLTAGELTLAAPNFAIHGPGTNLLTIERASSAATPFRIFTVFQNVTASIKNLTIARGAPAAGSSGGGILNAGELTVQNVAFIGNAVTGTGSGGGGIENSNVLNASFCTFTSNAGGFGGAIDVNEPDAVAVIDSCTFNLNSGSSGGAMYIEGTASIKNSTFSSNTSATNGGALRNNGVLTLVNCTVVGNRAADGGTDGAGGGIKTTLGQPTTLYNTIVVGNVKGFGGGVPSDLDVNVMPSSFNNLIGDAGSAGGLVNVVNGNIVGNGGILNPTLADNGGPTKTHALVANSLALGAASEAAPGFVPVDQRGVARHPGAPNIGSVEDPNLLPNNGAPGVSITPSASPLVAHEGGAAASYLVVLTGKPSANVTITPVGNPRLSFQPASLVFTPQNWNVAQTMLAVAVNDDQPLGDPSFNLAHQIASADAAYAALSVPLVPVTVDDDDVFGIVLTPASGITLAEGGASSSYTIRLSNAPAANLTVHVTPDADLSVNTTTLTFTTANWNTPQTVTVTAVDDALSEGPHTGTIQHVVFFGDAGLFGPDQVVAITDNDFGLVLQQSDGNTTVAEGEPGDTYDISLSQAPTADVKITFNPDSPLRLTHTLLTFTPSNWNVPQSVGLSAPNTFKQFASRTLSVVNTAASADFRFQGLTSTLPVTLTGSRPDIIGRDQTGTWTINKNTGASFTQTQPIMWNESVQWIDVRTADLNGDGRQDIIGRVRDSGQVWVAVSSGPGAYVNQLWAVWSPAVTWVDVTIGDFNADGRQDILARTKESGEWWTSYSTGSGFFFQRFAVWSTAVTWVDVVSGDFNGDGKTDIAGRALQYGQWWLGITAANADPKSGFHFDTTRWETWSTAVTWVDVRVGDFNGDGKDDLAGRAQQYGEWWLAISSGASFTSAKWETWNPRVNWTYVNVGDFNGDGKADIVGREGNNLWVSWSTGTAFTTSFGVGGLASDLIDQFSSFDFTGDGRSDFVGRSKATGKWFVFAAKAGTAGFENPVVWTTWAATSTYKDVQRVFTL
jgi:hypothetical protein